MVECECSADSDQKPVPAQDLDGARMPSETPSDSLGGGLLPDGPPAYTEDVHLVGGFERSPHEQPPATNAPLGGTDLTFDTIANVLRDGLPLLKTPIGWVLLFYALALLSQVQDAFRKVLAPICSVPGVASTPMCYVPLPSTPRKPADYAKLSQIQISSFEQLLEVSSTSLEIKTIEMGIDNLIVLVEHSDMIALAEHLRRFVDAAKDASRGLTRLHSHVNVAVDSIIAVHDHSLRTIEAAARKEASVLSIFRPFIEQPDTERVVATMFGNAMSVLSNDTRDIVLEAEVSLKRLDRLEEMLKTLYEIVRREDGVAGKEKEEILAQLWTMLGGNQDELRSANTQLDLLRQIRQYYERARSHVVVTLDVLNEMSDNMEVLRGRVTAPGLLGDEIPVEAHLKSIQEGVDKLTVARMNAQSKKENARRELLRDGTTSSEDS